MEQDVVHADKCWTIPVKSRAESSSAVWWSEYTIECNYSQVQELNIIELDLLKKRRLENQLQYRSTEQSS